MQAIANRLCLFRWFRDNDGNTNDKELGILETKVDDKQFSNLMEGSANRHVTDVGKSATARKNNITENEKQLSGFLKKLIKILTESRYYYFIKYEKESKSVFIPSKRDFARYVLKCESSSDEPIFKASSFSVFHRQMKLRGFEVNESMIKQIPGRIDKGIGYKANDSVFIKEIANILKNGTY